MEWLWLVVSISVFSSHLISVSISLSLPRSLILELSVALIPTGNSPSQEWFLHVLIKFNCFHGGILSCIWLGSVIRLQVGLSVRWAPLFSKCFVLGKLGCLSITTEERWSGFIEISLILHKVTRLPPVMWPLELVLLLVTSSCNFISSSTEFTISFFPRDKPTILWINVLF